MFPICILTGVIYSTINLAWTPELPMKETIEYLWACLCPLQDLATFTELGMDYCQWLDRVCWLLLSWQLHNSWYHHTQQIPSCPCPASSEQKYPAAASCMHESKYLLCNIYDSVMNSLIASRQALVTPLPQSTICSGLAPCKSWGRARELECAAICTQLFRRVQLWISIITSVYIIKSIFSNHKLQ